MVEARETKVQSYSQLHCKFEAMEDYMKPCIRKERKEGGQEGGERQGGKE